MPFKRQCPECGTELVYANLPGYRRACREKSICRRCAASPSVIHKRVAEAEKRAAEITDENFMAAFFESIEACLSGSMDRK